MKRKDKQIIELNKAKNDFLEAIAIICKDYHDRAERKMANLKTIDIEVKQIKT